jgi:hypothetical protein
MDKCNKVKNCAAFGMGVNDSSIGDVFQIKLYGCVQKLDPLRGWTTYRKQDSYMIPIENMAGDEQHCTKVIDDASRTFLCNMNPVPEGGNLTLQSCDGANPAQKFRIDDVSSKLQALQKAQQQAQQEAQQEAQQQGLRGKLDSRRSSSSSRLRGSEQIFRHASGNVSGSRKTCELGGLWVSSSGSSFEIEISSDPAMPTMKGLTLLALTPLDWLTAIGSAYYVLEPTGMKITIDAFFDNGNRDMGFVNDACSQIHWGPKESADITPSRFAWATACNDSDASQQGWSVYSDGEKDTTIVHVKYTSADLGFTGCLNSVGDVDGHGWLSITECTGLKQQTFVKHPIDFDEGIFVLQSAHAPNLCVDIYQAKGPAMEMYDE